MINRSTIRRAYWCACAALSMASCGSSPQVVTSKIAAPAAAGGAAANPAAAVLTDPPVNPLDAWFKGAAPDSVRRNGEESAVTACMKQAGLTWAPRVYPESEPTTQAALRKYRASFGYGIYTTANPVTAENDPNLKMMRSLTEAQLGKYLDVLEGAVQTDGTRAGGCRSKAFNTSKSAVEVRSKNPNAVKLWDEMINSSEHAAATTAWSKCMSSAGYAGLGSPPDAMTLAVDSGAADKEIAIASADIRCSEVSLWPVWAKVGAPAVKVLGPG